MKCPCCLQLMSSRVDKLETEYLDLFCNNNYCHSIYNRTIYNIPNITSYMRLISKDSSWVCDSYLLFINENYILRGEFGDTILETPREKLTHRIGFPDEFYTNVWGKDLVTISFVPLPTGDDMHEHAIKLTNKLISLIAFI